MDQTGERSKLRKERQELSGGLQKPVSPGAKEKVDMPPRLPAVPLSFLRKGC